MTDQHFKTQKNLRMLPEKLLLFLSLAICVHLCGCDQNDGRSVKTESAKVETEIANEETISQAPSLPLIVDETIDDFTITQAMIADAAAERFVGDVESMFLSVEGQQYTLKQASGPFPGTLARIDRVIQPTDCSVEIVETIHYYGKRNSRVPVPGFDWPPKKVIIETGRVELENGNTEVRAQAAPYLFSQFKTALSPPPHTIHEKVVREQLSFLPQTGLLPWVQETKTIQSFFLLSNSVYVTNESRALKTTEFAKFDDAPGFNSFERPSAETVAFLTNGDQKTFLTDDGKAAYAAAEKMMADGFKVHEGGFVFLSDGSAGGGDSNGMYYFSACLLNEAPGSNTLSLSGRAVRRWRSGVLHEFIGVHQIWVVEKEIQQSDRLNGVGYRAEISIWTRGFWRNHSFEDTEANKKTKAESGLFSNIRNDSENFVYRIVNGKPDLRSTFGQVSGSDFFDDETDDRGQGNILEGNFKTAKIAQKIIEDAQIELSAPIAEDSPETLDVQRTMLSKESR